LHAPKITEVLFFEIRKFMAKRKKVCLAAILGYFAIFLLKWPCQLAVRPKMPYLTNQKASYICTK